MNNAPIASSIEKMREASVQGVRVCVLTNFLSARSRSTAAPTMHDVVIDRGEISKRKKKPSKKFREPTPLSVEEKIPWKCRRLVVGTGAQGGLPVMEEVKQEAQRRKIELLVLPTTEAIKALQQGAKDTNAVLIVNC